MVAAEAVAVGHAGDVFADDVVGRADVDLLAVGSREAGGVGFEVIEKAADHLDGTFAFGVQSFGEIHAMAKEAFEFEAGFAGIGAEAGEALGVMGLKDDVDRLVAALGDVVGAAGRASQR